MLLLIISLILLSIFFTSNTFSQENFVWDETFEIEGDKYELFLKAKRYTAYSKNIHYIDEPNFSIYSQGKIKVLHEKDNIIFSYRLVILAKDNRVRIIIDSVVCAERKYKNMPASYTYPTNTIALEPQLYFAYMKDLRNNLNDLVTTFEKDLRSPILIIDYDW